MAILWKLITVVALLITPAFSVSAQEFIGEGFGSGERGPMKPQEEIAWYGAIAYDSSSGNIGSSDGFKSSKRAESVALARCGVEDCRIMTTARNNCVALAESEENYGVGKGRYAHEAMEDAIGYFDGKGQVIEWICSGH